jgi:hypothetical protein
MGTSWVQLVAEIQLGNGFDGAFSFQPLEKCYD